jgi:predicted ATPase
LTSFVGRERVVAAVVDRLRRADVRLLTLTGPGGVGKTRLAVRAAEVVAADFPDGVWFVPLAPVRDPDLIAPTIARTLGVKETGERPIAEDIAAFFGVRRGLLVLDNFEHVLDAGPLVTVLLAACPTLKALVTSRTVLRLSGEHDVTVPPLSLPSQGVEESRGRAANDTLLDSSTSQLFDSSEAVRLFVERAAAADAAFAFTGATANDVAMLCTRLDGLPLAIELAAARVRALPPQVMLRRLDQRFRLLTGGARDQPPRLRSLRDAIAWSHDLLTPEEQALFRRLAAFVGGCTLEAAEAVGAAEGDSVLGVLEGIASLTDKSLLRQMGESDGEPRFVMLETIRDFALERLEASGEEAKVRDRHASWCLQLAERTEASAFGDPEQRAQFDRLQADYDNVRAALAWSLDQGDAAGLRLAAAMGGFW